MQGNTGRTEEKQKPLLWWWGGGFDYEKDENDDDDDDGGGGEIRNVKLAKSKVRLLCFDFEKHKKCSMFPIDVLATM